MSRPLRIAYPGAFYHVSSRGNEGRMVLSFNEIGAYFGMKGSAISQLSRGFKETIEGDKGLGGILSKIKEEGFLNAEA